VGGWAESATSFCFAASHTSSLIIVAEGVRFGEVVVVLARQRRLRHGRLGVLPGIIQRFALLGGVGHNDRLDRALSRRVVFLVLYRSQAEHVVVDGRIERIRRHDSVPVVAGVEPVLDRGGCAEFGVQAGVERFDVRRRPGGRGGRRRIPAMDTIARAVVLDTARTRRIRRVTVLLRLLECHRCHRPGRTPRRQAAVQGGLTNQRTEHHGGRCHVDCCCGCSRFFYQSVSSSAKESKLQLRFDVRYRLWLVTLAVS